MTTCFIAMPISTPTGLVEQYANDRDHFKHVLEYLLVPAVNRAEMDPIPPTASGADLIHAEIIKHLETADVVLCDMSTLNANVFFELGIRAVDKPVCLVIDSFVDSAPFDTTVLNYHRYDASLTPWDVPAEIEKLANHLKESHERCNGQNPLWRFFGLTKRAEPAKVNSPEGKLDLILAQLQNLEPLLRRSQRSSFRPIQTSFERVPELKLNWTHDLDLDDLSHRDKAQSFAFVSPDHGTLGIVDHKNKVISLWRRSDEGISKSELEELVKKAGYALKWIDMDL